MKNLSVVRDAFLLSLLLIIGFSSDSAGLRGQGTVTEDLSPISGVKGSRENEVIYGRKHGVALTMDVFTPENTNGLGCMMAVSGGWLSHRGRISHPLLGGLIEGFLKGGYTVFAVVHSSQPKYTIPEILEDMHRAVRFVRYHAGDYGVDPDRLGVTGGSAGCHLALMQGTAGEPGNPDSKDPVERESSRVQAVACYNAPTDFLNYGEPGEIALGRGILKNYRAPFDFHEFDKQSRSYVPVTDVALILEIGRAISPINHVSPDDPPTLLVHGDADKLVPIQQSISMVEKLKEAGVEARLVIKEGGGHGWPNITEQIPFLVDWCDVHLGVE